MENIQGLLDKYKKIQDERFFDEIFNNNEYSPILDIKSDIVVDVGALAGEFSTYIYKNAQVIYALEPNNDHYKELTDNINEFNLEKIKPFNLALSDINGHGLLNIEARGGHRLVGQESSTTQETTTKTLATFIREQGIAHVDILKIDIEGGEQAVFGSLDFKEVANMIKVIVGEHLVGLHDLLSSYGYKRRDYMNNAIYYRV